MSIFLGALIIVFLGLCLYVDYQCHIDDRTEKRIEEQERERLRRELEMPDPGEYREIFEQIRKEIFITEDKNGD